MGCSKKFHRVFHKIFHMNSQDIHRIPIAYSRGYSIRFHMIFHQKSLPQRSPQRRFPLREALGEDSFSKLMISLRLKAMICTRQIDRSKWSTPLGGHQAAKHIVPISLSQVLTTIQITSLQSTFSSICIPFRSSSLQLAVCQFAYLLLAVCYLLLTGLLVYPTGKQFTPPGVCFLDPNTLQDTPQKSSHFKAVPRTFQNEKKYPLRHQKTLKFVAGLQILKKQKK